MVPEIFEGSRDAIFLSDASAALVHVNHAACELSGYSRDELLRLRIPDLHEERDLDAFRTYFASILDGKPATTEAYLRRRDGTRAPVEFSNRCVEIGGRKFLHTIARDISERKRAEDQARLDAALVRALASRLAEAETAERRRLALELHDRVGQGLTALGLNLSLLRLQIAEGGAGVMPRLDLIQALAEETTACTREVMGDLQPSTLVPRAAVAANCGLAVTFRVCACQPRSTSSALSRSLTPARPSDTIHAG